MTLYVPGAVLDEGPNELVLFELESAPRGGETGERKGGWVAAGRAADGGG